MFSYGLFWYNVLQIVHQNILHALYHLHTKDRNSVEEIKSKNNKKMVVQFYKMSEKIKFQ